MYRTYAVDPAVVRSIADLHLLRERFASTTGRKVARYPGKWERMVHDATSTWTEIQKAKVTEYLVQLRRFTHKEAGRDWDPGRDWLVNAEREHGARPFHAVIGTSNPRSSSAVLVWDELTDTSEQWQARPMRDIPRTASALAEAVGPLLRYAEQWIFIDPNFDPIRPKWQRPLKEMLLCGLEGRDTLPSCIEYHVRSSGSETTWYAEHCRSTLAPALPKGLSIKVRRWEQVSGGPSLHDRHVITESLGLDCSFGLDEATEAGEDGHQRIYLLSDEAHRADTSRYLSASPAFRLIDEVVVVGTGEP